MKKIVSLVVFIGFIVVSTIAQNGFVISINDNYSQNNISIDYQRSIGSHQSFSAGIKFIQKINSVPDNVSPFRHRFYPTNFVDYLGLDFNYKYCFIADNPRINPFIFDNLQFTQANVVSDQFDILDKTIALENNVGLGLQVKIMNNFNLFVRGGIGFVYIPNSPQVIVAGKWDNSSDFGGGFIFNF